MKTTINSYNEHALEYAVESTGRGARVDDVELIFKLIKKKDPFIVELGCGNGRDAKEFLKRTDRYLGMDASEKLIEEARKTNPGLNFEVATFTDFRFPRFIDGVVAFASLLHTNRATLRKILKRAADGLNPNGIVFLSMYYGGYEKLTRTDNMGTRTFYHYTPEDILRLATKEFKEIYRERQNIRGKKWFNLVLQKRA